MKWKSVVEDYFTFTKPQRRSIFIALSFIIFCIAVRFSYSYFFSVKAIPADQSFLQEANRITQSDSSQPNRTTRYQNKYNTEEDETNYREPYKNYTAASESSVGELFPFDPNTLDTKGWKRLGVREKTIATIQNYVSKGGHFRQPEDIKRIYGLRPNEAERLLPYVRIANETASPVKEYVRKEITASNATYTPAAPAMIDINTADTSAFIALPGIGSKLASRIVDFRNRLGGFYKIEQLGETYGLPDSTFQKLKQRFKLSSTTLKKLNVNGLDANGLKANPYIRWNVANAIVQYRQQHGNYSSLNDLKKIALVDEQLLSKILPYLTIDNE